MSLQLFKASVFVLQSCHIGESRNQWWLWKQTDGSGNNLAPMAATTTVITADCVNQMGELDGAISF